MKRVQRLVVGAIGVTLSAVGILCVATLILVLAGVRPGAEAGPGGGEAGGTIVFAATAGLAAVTGGIGCAVLLRRRRVPPPRRATFVDVAPEGGRHSTSG